VVRAIIFKKQDRGEADELVVFFSRELGWLSGVAKNAKKSRVRFGGHLEPFSLVDLSLRKRRKDDLVWIDESQVLRGFLGIRKHIAKVARASYFLELASVFLGEAQPDPELFDFLVDILDALSVAGPDPMRFLLDEIRLLGFLGYEPRFDWCSVCGKRLDVGQGVVFSPSGGGTCHVACAGPSLFPPLPLSPDTLAVVRRGLRVDREVAGRLKLNRKGQEELRNALSAFVRHLRGAEISSLVFLEKMGL